MKYIFITFFTVTLSLGLWAFWIEPASIRTSEHYLTLPNWPKACANLKIAVLSDLHVGSPFNDIENLRKILRVTQQTKPDLILLPGDFVIQGVLGGAFEAPEDIAKLLGKLTATIGTYAVLGNHDWWLDAKRIQSSLEAEGIPVLEDRSINIVHEECSFSLIGVSDFTEGQHDIQKAVSTISKNDASLLFTHNPDIFPEVPNHITLTIAGHTHGGQVYIPGIGRPIIPSNYGERFAIGHIVESGKHLFVSSGIGTSILPVRFLVPPEITLLILN